MRLSEVANSLVLTLGVTIVAALLGVQVALAAHVGSRSLRWVWLGLAIGVLALPGFFVAGVWMDWVGFAGAWRVGGGGWTERWLPLGCSIVVLSFLLWPVTTLLVVGAWDGIDGRLLEATPELRGIAVARHVLWPVARPALRQAMLITAILAFANFTVPALFQARVWTAEVWMDFSTRFDALDALSRSWVPAVLMLILAGAAFRHPVRWPASLGVSAGAPLRSSMGRGRVRGIRLSAIGILVVSLALPIASALVNPRTWTEFRPALEAAWPAAARSLIYAGATATLVCLVGMALAHHRWPLVTAAAFALPGIFLGIAVSVAFNQTWSPPGNDSPAIVVAAFALRYGFVGWFAASQALRSANPALREVLRMEGGGRWSEWRHVVWPRSGGLIRGAWCVVYLLCLWDVETLILVVPPGGDSLALMIFNLLHYGHNAQVTALCLALALLAGLPLLLAGGSRLMLRGLSPGRVAATLAILVTAMGFNLGCTRAATSSSAPLASRLFERVDVIGARGTGPGFFNKPRSVAVDGDDNLYAVDFTGRIQKFSPEGQWLALWQMPETDKGRPKGMATAPGGDILLVEPHYNRVNQFSPGGQLVLQWGRRGTNAGDLWFPRAIAVNAHAECFVCEYGVVERVQRFNLKTGAFLGAFGEAGTGPGQFNRAEGLDVDAQGRVYVADACNHRIQVFDGDGRFIRQHGRAGRASGEFSYPYDIRVDREGRQYVCEFGNSRIQVFDPNDTFMEALGKPGSAPDEMNNPWSLCLDSRGNLYVADSANHRVLKFIRRRGRADQGLNPRQVARVDAAGSRREGTPQGIGSPSHFR